MHIENGGRMSNQQISERQAYKNWVSPTLNFSSVNEGEMYDVGIEGLGITGAFNLYVLSFTNLRVFGVERYPNVALVNSNTHQNAQSWHGGPEETNFGFDKTMIMRVCELVGGAFLESFGQGAFMHLPKMALAVGQEEVDTLWQRFLDLREYFPALEFMDKKVLEEREPALIIGRDPQIPVVAMGRQNGYAVDYHRVALCLMREVQDRTKNIDAQFNTNVEKVVKHANHFEVITDKGTYKCRVFIATGRYPKNWTLFL